MALIAVKKQKDEYGREQIIYCDTDDLTQEDYYEFCRLQESGKQQEALNFILSKTY